MLFELTGIFTRYSIVGIAVDFKTPLPCPMMYSDSLKWLPHSLLLLQGFHPFSLPVAVIHRGKVSAFVKGNLR